MLLRGTNKPNDAVNKISVTAQLGAEPSPAFVPHRHAFTAKLRSRPSQLSHMRTVAIKPISGPQANSNHTDSQNEHPSKNQKHSLNNSQRIKQFDNLQLQDFVKMAILGQNEAIQNKSKEIIKSLNGTWFKSTRSEELSSHKLYNNLGIKRTKLQSPRNDQPQTYNSRDVLKKHYTPPNIFPQRKLSPRRNQLSKYLQGTLNTNFSQIIERSSPLKESVLRKTSQSKRPPKRSSTSFTTKLLDVKYFEQSGYLLGRKMVLHNE